MWAFCSVLSNITVTSPIEYDDFAIVPIDDSRIASQANNTNAPVSFVRKFVDNQGQCIAPSILIYRVRGGRQRPRELMADRFCHIVALSVIAKSLAVSLSAKGKRGCIYSDHFLQYPYGLNQARTGLVCNAWAGANLVLHNQFVGQPSAHLPGQHVLNPGSYMDSVLYQELNRRRFPKIKDRKIEQLFRSLQIACTAATALFESRASIYSIGTRVILWISAFEILAGAMYGKGSRENVGKLFDLSGDGTQYLHKKLYTLKIKTGEKTYRANFCQRLIAWLYKLRNDHAHGNSTKKNDLSWVKRNPSTNAVYVAPLLYAIALYRFLGITSEMPSDYEKGLNLIRSSFAGAKNRRD
jgi:hypothetical protein